MRGNLYLSVVIPVYNEEEYIETCLKSVLDQTLPQNEYEVIVVDNASTDKTLEIIKKFPVKIIHEARRSVVIARQTGTTQASGQIIVSADGDTYYPPNWLTNIKSNFTKNPGSVALVGWIYFRDITTADNLSVALNQEINLWLSHLGGKFPLVYAANFAFTKEALLTIGGYPAHLPELGDQQYLLYKFFRLGRVIIDKKVFCKTSGRRHKELVKDILVYNGWHRITGYLVNSFLGRELIGPAPAVRTTPPQKSH